MLLLLRTLLIWNLIIWREVISAFKCFHSHISIVSQNIQKPLLQKIHTNNRILQTDLTRMYHTMAALLCTNEAGKRGQNYILSRNHNYLLLVTMPHIILNKQSEYLSAPRDLKPRLQNTRVSSKDEQRITASLCPLLLSPQSNRSKSHLLISHPGVPISMIT